MIARSVTLAGVALAATLLLGACGGDDNGAPAPTSPPATATAAPAATVAATPASTPAAAPEPTPAATETETPAHEVGWTPAALCELVSEVDIEAILGAPVRGITEAGNAEFPSCEFQAESNWMILISQQPPFRSEMEGLQGADLVLALLTFFEDELMWPFEPRAVGDGGVQLTEAQGATPAGTIYAVSGGALFEITSLFPPDGVDVPEALAAFSRAASSGLSR